MLSKVVVWSLFLHLSIGQVPQPSPNNPGNPFIFDLPPLKLEPLQIRLNPSSASFVLLNKNQSIPIETFPSDSRSSWPTTQPQPPTQLPKPQTWPSSATFTPTANPLPASASQSQLPTLVPMAFKPFTQLSAAQNQPKPDQNLQTLRSQIFRPFVFSPVSPQSLPLTSHTNPTFTSFSHSSSQSSTQPFSTVQQNSQSNVWNNMPKESSVTYENHNFENVVRDLSSFLPIQLPGQTVIFNQAQAQAGQPHIQTEDKNTRFLAPVVLPAFNLPEDEVRMVAVDVTQTQTDANTQSQPGLITAEQERLAPAAPNPAPQPVQAENPTSAQVQPTQPSQLEQPAQSPQNFAPLPASPSLQSLPSLTVLPQLSPLPAQAAVSQPTTHQQKPTFKPLSFRSVPFQTSSPSQKPSNGWKQKQDSTPKVQSLTQQVNNKPNGSNKMVTQHLSFGQSTKQSGPSKWTDKQSQTRSSPPALPAQTAIQNHQTFEFGVRLNKRS